ncbi:protein insensitive-like [Leguminivora glycinivorella]|uniref:protein insensitive-like n=1 Tax=Leguminivora glycinivorella TaxID=1035111 RepID=UPI00200C4309|nr:protein insensitive-like [Leguminivora glycinivorella]XP_047992308.1 protein insensitive-like [Leguminivora glycinivorella]
MKIPKGNGMVPIGERYAIVPARVLKQIDWRLRKLLTSVFTRRELATHSLTVKSSPAFPGKPAKKRLDPGGRFLSLTVTKIPVENGELPIIFSDNFLNSNVVRLKNRPPERVNDIVQLVEISKVKASLVRTSITTKCADKSKMYRSRQQNKKKRFSNQENFPPLPHND